MKYVKRILLSVLILICIKYLIGPYKNYFANEQKPEILPPISRPFNANLENQKVIKSYTAEELLGKENVKEVLGDEKR
jgi:hypothetical protein